MQGIFLISGGLGDSGAQLASLFQWFAREFPKTFIREFFRRIKVFLTKIREKAGTKQRSGKSRAEAEYPLLLRPVQGYAGPDDPLEG